MIGVGWGGMGGLEICEGKEVLELDGAWTKSIKLEKRAK